MILHHLTYPPQGSPRLKQDGPFQVCLTPEFRARLNDEAWLRGEAIGVFFNDQGLAGVEIVTQETWHDYVFRTDRDGP